jgi:serine phosphatase RsbU (regulator of sigma subunit)
MAPGLARPGWDNLSGMWIVPMPSDRDLTDKLALLTRIAETLNRAVDVRGVLNHTLADLVKLMNLRTGWIFLRDPAAQDRRWGSGYVLAAHHNLPPALNLDSPDAWDGGCQCQELCDGPCLHEAYNQVRCSRLASVSGDRRGLVLHASTPLRSGDQILGILNVAGPDWASFSREALTLLTNVGSQMGIALERARLFDLLQEQRIHEQAALLAFSNQLLARHDLDDLMAYLVEEVRKMLQADACALLLPTEEVDILDFQAASGWRGNPVAAHRQVPADGGSGLGVAMGTQQPLVVADIQQHDPVPWLPAWLEEEGFRGHAVMPLVAAGQAVGALVLDMRQPRLLDEHETRLLHLMANQAAIAIEKARLHKEEVLKKSLERDLEIGREIQRSLLPQSLPAIPGWEFAVYYQAARQVGGDFYDFLPLPGTPDRIGLVIADAAGKGVPAALFMTLSRTTIRAAALSHPSPAAALGKANELILNDSHSTLFVTACYATLETGSGRLVFSNAGHNRPLWYRAATGAFEELVARGIVLGSFARIELEEREIDFAPGDLLVLYTDGVTEAMNAERQPFGEERLRAAVAATAGGSAQEVVAAIVDAANSFADNLPQSDDCTLLVVKRCP